MDEIAPIPLHPRTNGEILDASVRLVFRRFGFYFLLSLAAALPMILAGIAAILIVYFSPNLGFLTESVRDPGQRVMLIFAAAFVLFIIPILWWMGIFHGAQFHAMTAAVLGRRATFGESFRAGLKRPFSVVSTDALIGIGIAFCCIPGFFLAAAFWPAGPIVTLENIGWTRALDRAGKLTSGHRWRVLGLFVIMMVITSALTTPFSLPLSAVDFLRQHYSMPEWFVMVAWICYGIALLVQFVLQIFARSAQVLCYLDLRVKVEGLDMEIAARSASAGIAGANPAGNDPDAPPVQRR